MKSTLSTLILVVVFGIAACSPTPSEVLPTIAPTIDISIPVPLPPEFFPPFDPPVFSPAIPCNPLALIDAINRANLDPAHDTIILPPGCTIILTDVNNVDGGAGPNGLPVISTPITIQARYTGTDVVRVERSSASRIPSFRLFFVSASGELTLDGGYYSNGLAPSGAGVYNEGIFGMYLSNLLNNTATSNGGGLYNLGTANLGPAGGIDNNRAFMGGGIYNAGGRVNLTSFGWINGNFADSDGGGIFNSRAGQIAGSSNFQYNNATRGGAIFNYGKVDINNRGRLSFLNVADAGGFIYNVGVLGLIEFAAWENSAIVGGVVYNEGEATLINNSYFDNIAHLDGAAIFNTGSLSLTNSTMSGNVPETTSVGPGGESAPGGVVSNTGTLILEYVTIAENGGSRAALLSDGGSISISNSIVAANAGGDCRLGGSVTLIGTNLNMDGSCTGFPITADPLLDPLANIGAAPLMAHKPGFGSPVLDAATGACPPTDQVGTARPAGSACDIGAIEVRIREDVIILLPTAEPADSPSAKIDTICYWGPGEEYGTVNSIPKDTEVKLLGRGQTAGWIIVDTPINPGIACWAPVGDFDLDPDLDLNDLPEYPVPPMPDEDEDATKPAAPSNLTLSKACDLNQGGDNTVKLSWTDNSDNEDGFRIYRDGVLIATVGANTTVYEDKPVQSVNYNYSVEAVNSAGASSRASLKIDVNC